MPSSRTTRRRRVPDTRGDASDGCAGAGRISSATGQAPDGGPTVARVSAATTRRPYTPSARPRRRFVGVVVASLALSTFSQFGHRAVAASSPPSGPNHALTSAGRELAATVDWASRPNYRLFAALDPASGAVSGRVEVGAASRPRCRRRPPAVVPGRRRCRRRRRRGRGRRSDGRGHGRSLAVDRAARRRPWRHRRVVGSLPLRRSGLHARLARPEQHGQRAAARRHRTARPWSRLSGARTLVPHIRIPPGRSTEPELDGYGDIANFPAATISALLDVRAGSTVVTSGVRLDEVVPQNGHEVVHEGGTGLRDFAVVVFEGADQLDVVVGDTSVVVTAPAGHRRSSRRSATSPQTSVTALGAAFGPVPVDRARRRRRRRSAPASAAWSGRAWCGSSRRSFEGGVPGLGDLG